MLRKISSIILSVFGRNNYCVSYQELVTCGARKTERRKSKHFNDIDAANKFLSDLYNGIDKSSKVTNYTYKPAPEISDSNKVSEIARLIFFVPEFNINQPLPTTKVISDDMIKSARCVMDMNKQNQKQKIITQSQHIR